MENILRFESNKVEEVIVHLAWGQLTVVRESVEKLQVIATGDEATVKELRIQTEDEKLLVEQPQYGLSMSINSSKWLEVVIRVPKEWKIDLDAQTISGGMNVRGIVGEDMNFESISGNIIVGDIKSEKTYIRTISGDVRGEKLTGEKMTVRTGNGTILLEQLTFDKVSGFSVSGKMTISCQEPFKEMEYNTAAGDISLYVPAKELDISYKSLRGNLRTEGIEDKKEGAEVKITTATGDASIVSTLA